MINNASNNDLADGRDAMQPGAAPLPKAHPGVRCNRHLKGVGTITREKATFERQQTSVFKNIIAVIAKGVKEK